MIKTLADKLPRIALILSLLLVAWFLVAMFGAKADVIDKLTAFGTMTIQLGGIFAAIVAVIAIIALILSLVVKPRRGWLAALIALAIPLCVFGGFNALRSQAGNVPFIYDVATDTDDPPTFSDAITKARADDGANDLIPYQTPLGELEKWKGNPDIGTTTAAALIAEGYPDLKPLPATEAVEDVVEVIKAAMEMRGFDNVTADAEAGRVEGTDEVFWYGFRDDVVARARAQGEGSVVDFRSVSRVGTSDLGVNAERIMDLRKAVEDRLTTPMPSAEPIMEAVEVSEEGATEPAEVETTE